MDSAVSAGSACMQTEDEKRRAGGPGLLLVDRIVKEVAEEHYYLVPAAAGNGKGLALVEGNKVAGGADSTLGQVRTRMHCRACPAGASTFTSYWETSQSCNTRMHNSDIKLQCKYAGRSWGPCQFSSTQSTKCACRFSSYAGRQCLAPGAPPRRRASCCNSEATLQYRHNNYINSFKLLTDQALC